MTTKILLLSSLVCLTEDAHLDQLNRMLTVHSDLMPHQLSAAIGCDAAEAMKALLLLVDKGAADAYLLVYHSLHPDSPPIQIAPIAEGLPTLPFTCDTCEEVIDDASDLFYDFLFKIQHDVQFITRTESNDAFGS
jgi:hypothetical protein